MGFHSNMVLKIALRQLHCKTQAPNPATPYDQFNSCFVTKSLSRTDNGNICRERSFFQKA
jgi:hypothetical protein